MGDGVVRKDLCICEWQLPCEDLVDLEVKYWSRLVKISSIWRRVKCCHISWMMVYGSPSRVDYRSWLDCHKSWIVLKVIVIAIWLACFTRGGFTSRHQGALYHQITSLLGIYCRKRNLSVLVIYLVLTVLQWTSVHPLTLMLETLASLYQPWLIQITMWAT